VSNYKGVINRSQKKDLNRPSPSPKKLGEAQIKVSIRLEYRKRVIRHKSEIKLTALVLDSRWDCFNEKFL